MSCLLEETYLFFPFLRLYIIVLSKTASKYKCLIWYIIDCCKVTICVFKMISEYLFLMSYKPYYSHRIGDLMDFTTLLLYYQGTGNPYGKLLGILTDMPNTSKIIKITESLKNLIVSCWNYQNNNSKIHLFFVNWNFL